ncbi:MAG: hypothetical protein IT560_06565 [Alphaproteobacteria bacterium]|nr:hypothetical protein [Alphaproteobacteria bacterium]
MAFGDEYSSDYAYFIAGGTTLAAIKKYEADSADTKGMQAAIAKEYGAKEFTGVGERGYLVFDNPVENPALVLHTVYKSGGHVYRPNTDTAEGRALQEKFADVPEFDLSHHVFAKRLTGAETVATNPDHLRPSSGPVGIGHYNENATSSAASFRKYGDTYVVSVPRVIRGIFNEASAKASVEDNYTQAAGYTYERWTPPDSTEIPYSKVIELQEKQKGDQLAQHSVKRKIAVSAPGN